MKLCWLHRMPYTGLPADFADRHESVWVSIDPKLFDPQLSHALYHDEPGAHSPRYGRSFVASSGACEA